jgi:hypothetical protein
MQPELLFGRISQLFVVGRIMDGVATHTTNTDPGTDILPAEGLSLMDAKHVGVLTYHLF